MIIRLTLLGIVMYLVTLIPKHFLNLDYFNIKKVNVSGNSKMLETELTTLKEKIYNENSVYIDYNKIEELLKKDIRIDTISVENKSLGEVSVNVNDKKLEYYAMIGSQIYLVDKNGNIFGYFNEKQRESLPLIVIQNKEELPILLKILESLRETDFYKYISQIYEISNNDIRVLLINGTQLKTDENVSTEKYKVAKNLYFDLNKIKKIEYLDLRFNDYIIKYAGDVKNERKRDN